MFWSESSFWALLCKSLFYVYGFIIRYIFRFDGDENSHKIDLDRSVIHKQQDNQIDSNCFGESGSDGFGQKEKSEIGLRFRFRTDEDFSKSSGEAECPVFMETAPTASTSKYQFMSGKHISGFMEEPEAMSFTFHEFYVGSNDDSIGSSTTVDSGCSTNTDFQEHNLEEVAVDQEKAEDSAESFNSEEEVLGKQEDLAINQEKTGSSAESFSGEEDEQDQVTCTDRELSEKGEVAGLEKSFLDEHDFSDELQSLSENLFFSLNLEPGSNSSSGGMVTSTRKIDPIDDEFFSDGVIGNESERETCIPTDEKKEGSREEIPSMAESNLFDTSISDPETVSEDDYIELEPHSSVFHEEVSSGHDLGRTGDKHEPKDSVHREMETSDNSEKIEEPSLQEKEKPSAWDSDDEMEFDFLQEHQDLIQQLKMEIKYVKTGGLPTILEESESPKIVEDLKPLNIDKKIEHKDLMEEIQKFYKSYAEKMRKLDILNNQTMHALGLLRLKDTVKLNSTRKSSVPGIKSLLSRNLLRSSRVGNHEADPTQKFIRELHRDLEMVYVGQVCLSWEILYWQYWKAQELQDYDAHGSRRYNQVAGEYQQFQVLVRRFIENEPYQGPRIQNYVEKRCVLRSHLLQVPAIRDDCLKDKRGIKEEGEYMISSAMLPEIIEESMRLFWEFLHADKDEATVISRGLQRTRLDLEGTADSELLMDIQTNLQKKEKKLKDLLRSGNCIVKRFQKHQENQLGRALFFAQVEMKLVSRVLNMSRLTADQLVWCHKKLNGINFVSSRIHIEPTFLLFPC